MGWSTTDLTRHTGERVALPGNRTTDLKESSESRSLHLANLFTSRTVTHPVSGELVRAPSATSHFSQLPAFETFFISRDLHVESFHQEHSTLPEQNHWLVVRQHSLGGGASGEWDTQEERSWGVWLQITLCDKLPLQYSTNYFNKTVSLSTEWEYCHIPHRTHKKINKEGIRIAQGDLACHWQLWKAITHC